jgi:hypothetical protein
MLLQDYETEHREMLFHSTKLNFKADVALLERVRSNPSIENGLTPVC